MNDTSSTPSTTPIPNNYGVATSMADVQNQINEMEAFFETGIRNPPFNETKMHLLKLVMPGK